MNEKAFKDTFSRLRASEESRERLYAIAKEPEGRPARRRARPIKAAVAAFAAAALLTVTAAAAGGYLGGWSSGHGGELLERGPFEKALPVDGDTVELPHMLFGRAVERRGGVFNVYIFLARGTETLFDQIIDVRDEITKSPDHTYTYTYEDADVRVHFTVSEVREEPGYTLEHDLFIRDPATGEWVEAQGSLDSSDAFSNCGTLCQWYGDDGIHEPILVPATWERGQTVTGFGLKDFMDQERFK